MVEQELSRIRIAMRLMVPLLELPQCQEKLKHSPAEFQHGQFWFEAIVHADPNRACVCFTSPSYFPP